MEILRMVSGPSGLPLDLNNIFGLHFFLAPDFHYYQLFTYMFMHANITHIVFNMFALWMFGCVIERIWGAKKFLFYYICCGVGAGLFQEFAQYMQYITYMPIDPSLINQWTTVGASGAVYAILLAFGMLFPNERLFIIPFPFPIKAKWLVMGYVVIELYLAITTTGDGVAHVAHLGGMVFGFIMIKYWSKSLQNGNNKNRKGDEIINKIKRMFEETEREKTNCQSNSYYHDDRQTDRKRDARRKANQEEIDRILDKIRKSGYDALTYEEKQKLFDQHK
jgi:membrane associated rhomboid family serine protease